MKVKNILFPIDISDFCMEIVPQVISVAKKFDAEIHLVSAVEPLDRSAVFYVSKSSADDCEIQAKERIEHTLREFGNELFVSYRKVKHAALCGHPGEAVLEYINTAGIDLVIMATHRRKGLEKALLGSVADEVIRKSPVPVMTINPGERECGWRVSNIRPADELKLRPQWQDG